jgi:hypothetical protein
MRLVTRVFLASVVFLTIQSGRAISAQEPRGPQVDPPPPATAKHHQQKSADNAFVTLPPGTKIILALTNPVWAKSAHLGDSVYAVSAFPVALNNILAIPPGTYVEGIIDELSRPSGRNARAEFQMHFTKMVFANGYTVAISDNAGANSANQAPNPDPNLKVVPPQIGAAIADVHVAIAPSSDILLDNGSQIEMVLQAPIALNAAVVAVAARASKAPQIQWTSATRCRPSAGIPGTSDTVIPGSPGSSGTPDTVIPGVNGAPDTVIPGIPATPGTPDTVIPGSPGTPGTFCPGPPAVISEAGDAHKESFKVSGPVNLAGQTLAKGSYQLTWNGPGPTAEVAISQKGKNCGKASARVVELVDKSPKTRVDTAADSAVSVLSIQFKGKTFALTFDPAAQQATSEASAKSTQLKQ